jgi:16S rRNA (guanine527-N7)-methyltransferase
MFHVEQEWQEALRQGALQMQLPLSDEQIRLFQRYLEELKAWNAKINLTSITDNREIAIKHFLDSLFCSKVLLAGPLLDIGSGAGFPGLPLKILDPGLDVTLLEPNRKRTAFLHHMIGTLRLTKVRVLSHRVEDVASDFGFKGHFANLITRALDVHPLLLLLQALVAPAGQLILCRSEPLEGLASRAPFKVHKEVPYSLPGGLGRRVLTILHPKEA